MEHDAQPHQGDQPQRQRLRGELWKIPYIFASRMVSMFLGVGFVVARHPFYQGYYGNRPRAHGVSPLTDTQIAGGLMMSLDIVIIAGALIFFHSGLALPRSEYSLRKVGASIASFISERTSSALGQMWPMNTSRPSFVLPRG